MSDDGRDPKPGTVMCSGCGRPEAECAVATDHCGLSTYLYEPMTPEEIEEENRSIGESINSARFLPEFPPGTLIRLKPEATRDGDGNWCLQLPFVYVPAGFDAFSIDPNAYPSMTVEDFHAHVRKAVTAKRVPEGMPDDGRIEPDLELPSGRGP